MDIFILKEKSVKPVAQKQLCRILGDQINFMLGKNILFFK